MSDDCPNCGSRLTPGSTFKASNELKTPQIVSYINFINKSNYQGLCDKCGEAPLAQAHDIIDREIDKQTYFLENRLTSFPMFTTSLLPANSEFRLIGLITANVTVGTGIFSEISQGFSDLVGAVNLSSGMSFKVNKGEAAARSTLVMKAIALNANCVLGVDIDYGVTGNNAATINMQGTAAYISNLDTVLDTNSLARVQAFDETYARIAQLRQWRDGNISV